MWTKWGWATRLYRMNGDALSAHLLVRDEDGVLTATGRLYPRADGWRIGRIAVLRERRGRRLGDLAIRMLCARALDTVPDADITVYALPDVAPFVREIRLCTRRWPGARIRHNGHPHARSCGKFRLASTL